MNKFLEENNYIDFNTTIIQDTVKTLFKAGMSDEEKAKAAYEFVRDQIPHSFDCNATVITAKASDVLKYNTGICHAKSNLLAALLRAQGIPTGFCFQHITLLVDDSKGYCLHGYNAIYLNNKWIKLDARGNKQGVNAQFSLDKPILAFENRPQYDEYYFEGIYASPDIATMRMLENAKSIEDIINDIPEIPFTTPDIKE
jgi:Transglutaminase-like enzymes, putative cysteine proteases